MDHLRIHTYKIQTMKKHKKQQLLNDVILYSLTALTCTSLCSSPLWYPPFCATFNVFFFFSLPRITSFFFTSKILFIVGNLIVIFLLGESKFFTSKSKAYSGVSYGKHKCKRPDQLQDICSVNEQKGKGISKDTSKQDMQLEISKLGTCESGEDEEFFELYDGEGTSQSCVEDEKTETSSPKEKELRCSKGEVRIVEEEKYKGIEGDRELSLPTEELNKLVDDFIARINKQRMLEAELCRG